MESKLRMSRRESRYCEKLVSQEMAYLSDIQQYLNCFWYLFSPIANVIIFLKSIFNWENKVKSLTYLLSLIIFVYLEILSFFIAGIITYFFVSYYTAGKLDNSTVKKKFEVLLVNKILGEDTEEYVLVDDLIILNVSLNRVTEILLFFRSIFNGNSKYNYLLALLLITFGITNFYISVLDLISDGMRIFLLTLTFLLLVPPCKLRLYNYVLKSKVEQFRKFIIQKKQIISVEEKRETPAMSRSLSNPSLKTVDFKLEPTNSSNNVIKSNPNFNTINNNNNNNIIKNEEANEITKRFPNANFQGYLHKQNKSQLSSNRRYFVLSDNALYYFKSQTDPEQLGVIYLNQCTPPQSSESVKKNSFQIENTHIDRIYRLSADDEITRSKWIEAINDSFELMRKYQLKNLGTFRKVNTIRLPLDKLKKLTANELIAIGDVKHGFLSKQGNRVRNWKSRLFVLYGLELFYYKSRDSSSIGAIHLQGATVTVDANQENLFTVRDTTIKRDYFLIAENKEERGSWFQAINMSINSERSEEERFLQSPQEIAKFDKQLVIKPNTLPSSDDYDDDPRFMSRHVTPKQLPSYPTQVNNNNSNSNNNNSNNTSLSPKVDLKKSRSEHALIAPSNREKLKWEMKTNTTHKKSNFTLGTFKGSHPSYFQDEDESNPEDRRRTVQIQGKSPYPDGDGSDHQPAISLNDTIIVQKDSSSDQNQQSLESPKEKEVINNNIEDHSHDGDMKIHQSKDQNEATPLSSTQIPEIIIHQDYIHQHTEHNEAKITPNNSPRIDNMNQDVNNNHNINISHSDDKDDHRHSESNDAQNNNNMSNAGIEPRWNNPHRNSTSTSDSVNKAGYLFKRGENRKNWKKRYFILIGYKMTYYKLFGDKECKGEIDLRVCNKVKILENPKRSNCFSIFNRVTGREYILSAEDINERRLWIHAINESIVDHQPHLHSRPQSSFEFNPKVVEEKVTIPQPVSGYVFKKKNHQKISKWQKRFFVVTDNILYSYTSSEEQGRKPKTVFETQNLSVCDTLPNKEKEFCFILSCSKDNSSYTIAVNTKEEKEKWMSTLSSK